MTSVSEVRDLLELYTKNLGSPYGEYCKKVFGLDDFWTKPASLGRHCNWVGGLAEHTLNVLKVMRMLYNDCRYVVGFGKDEALFMTVIHDLGKIKVYGYVQREGDVVPVKGVVDEMGDHNWYTLQILSELGIVLTDRQLNALIYHHGGWSGQSVANLVFKRSIEMNRLAVLLHCADLIASQVFESEEE